MTVSVERAVFAATEFRSTAEAQDLSVKTRDPLSQELVFQTLCYSVTDANTIRDQVLELRKVNRNDWACSVRSSGYGTIQLGDTVTLIYPRFGFDAGKNFIVKSINKDQRSDQIGLTLFGPQ